MELDTEEAILIFDKAANYWGIEAQLLTVMEELLELAIACERLMARGFNHENYARLIDETADVTIMLEQLRRIANNYIGIPDFDARVKERIVFKMNRLAGKLLTFEKAHPTLIKSDR